MFVIPLTYAFRRCYIGYFGMGSRCRQIRQSWRFGRLSWTMQYWSCRLSYRTRIWKPWIWLSNMIKDIVRLNFKQCYDLVLEDAEGSKVAIDLNATSSDANQYSMVRSLFPRSAIDCLYLVVKVYHFHWGYTLQDRCSRHYNLQARSSIRMHYPITAYRRNVH
jgi:hypothetical protein